MFEDKVDRMKTVGFIRVLMRKTEKVRFSLAYDNFPGVLVLYWGPQKGALSGGVQNVTVRYITKTLKKFDLGAAKLAF